MNQFSKSDLLEKLVQKIYKFMSCNDKNLVKKIIINNKSLNISMKLIYDILVKYENYLKRDNNRQDFITSKILTHIQSIQPNLLNEQVKAIDIGGGNGNVLSGINKHLNCDKSQFVCVESNDWIENYKYDNDNITYLFWDNETLDVLDNSCDIVFCMVSLHHMTDDTISNALTEIHRILKKDGILIIKEHDCNSKLTHSIIVWEHHLYHLLDCVYDKRVFDFDDYWNNSIYNFKSKKDWQTLLESFGFKYKHSKNRFLDGGYLTTDVKNASNLYWDVYSNGTDNLPPISL